jgi:hypothetical protein
MLLGVLPIHIWKIKFGFFIQNGKAVIFGNHTLGKGLQAKSVKKAYNAIRSLKSERDSAQTVLKRRCKNSHHVCEKNLTIIFREYKAKPL